MSIDTSSSSPRASSCLEAIAFAPTLPSSSRPSLTRTTAQEKPHRPQNAGSPPSTRGPCGLRSHACKKRAAWGADGEGEKAAQRGQAGVVDGVQGHRARRTSNQDMFCTSPHTPPHPLVRFGEGTASPANPFHANWTGAHHHPQLFAPPSTPVENSDDTFARIRPIKPMSLCTRNTDELCSLLYRICNSVHSHSRMLSWGFPWRGVRGANGDRVITSRKSH